MSGSALYLDADAIAARRALVTRPGAPFAALADSLAADLSPVLARPVWPPPNKARLTRVGGTCPRDGARLLFDPFAPEAHRCPACGTVYARREDYEWWTMGYQLWLAERAVHAAALTLVRGDAACGAFAAAVLAAHADAYLAYPNADNVLGPTRLFFSTYLESLWLVHVCTALDLLEAAGAAPGSLGAAVRERVVAPSAALVTGYPEGRSNRQVWHAVARLAAARVLGDAAGAVAAVRGSDGVEALLRDALLADGSWYEGENYHQFAHRGFWYAFRLAERAGVGIDPALTARFRAGYAVPFRVALPDDTLPARRDSQYAVSLRQWRWAEWCELGLTDGAGPRLGASLARLYAPADPPIPHATGRWRATGEAERNEPASALSRADLGWKSLLFARPDLPPADAAAPRSELLAEQGFAILRRDRGRVYVGLDYGGGGGGHGHPDRLNLIVQDGPARWLDDPGTGTYVERTLHWYRSTLAHAAPLADGQSQRDARGVLLGFDAGDRSIDETDDATAFCGAAASATVGDVLASRAVVAANCYVVDRLAWRTDDEVRERFVDLPFPVDGTLGDAAATWSPFLDVRGAGGLEDGFDFVRDAERIATRARAIRMRLYTPGRGTDSGTALWLVAPDSTLWRAVAPGPPGNPERRFHAVRQRGTTGAVMAVWDLRGTIANVEVIDDGATVITFRDGRVDEHRAPDDLAPMRGSPSGRDWHIRVRRPDMPPLDRALALVARSAPLAGEGAKVGTDDSGSADTNPPSQVFTFAPADRAFTFELGESHYVRSEPTWREAGEPTATVRVRIAQEMLVVLVAIRLGRPPAFVAADAHNPLDNERADVNSDGLQLLLVPPGGPPAAWLLVPEHRPRTVRVTPTSPGGASIPLDVAWRARVDGWIVRCRLPLTAVAAPGGFFALDIAANERPPSRERRRGQLQLGEPRSPFVYLRGDRLDVVRALRFSLAPAAPTP